MADKTIYLHPGETVDIRFISDPDDETSAAAWRDQSRPEKMLLRVWPYRIAPADIAVDLDRRPEAWRE